MSDPGRRDRAAPRAVRLICVADPDGVRVVRRRRLDKVVPPSEPVEPQPRDGRRDAPRRSGFWLEVRDAEEHVRYRRVIPDPRPRRAEVPLEDGSFTQREAGGEVTFSLLVPDLDDGDHVTLLDGTPHGDVRAAGTAEVARLALHGPEDEEQR